MFPIKKYFTYSLPILAILILILDAKTAFDGARNGINICLKTIIPSLFPFFFLTGYIINILQSSQFKMFSGLGKICKIPSGSEPIYLLGLLGGYPIGAQAIYAAYSTQNISRRDAERMLGFCNNAGPAFIFGLIGCLFESFWIPWVIWLILIFTSFLTSIILPGKSAEITNNQKQQKINPLDNAIKATAKVCGWIIIFRVLLTVLEKWILWLYPAPILVFLTGLLELANGCTELFSVDNPVFRMTAAASILSFGGLCVGLQTMSVIKELNSKIYWISKLFQLCIALPLSYIVASVLFSQTPTKAGIILSIISTFGTIIVGCLLRKNNTGNSEYNIV